MIYRQLQDLSQELRVQKQEETIRTSAYHDVQLRFQAALAEAENHLEELKDPTAKSWYLRGAKRLDHDALACADLAAEGMAILDLDLLGGVGRQPQAVGDVR